FPDLVNHAATHDGEKPGFKGTTPRIVSRLLHIFVYCNDRFLHHFLRFPLTQPTFESELENHGGVSAVKLLPTLPIIEMTEPLNQSLVRCPLAWTFQFHFRDF